MRILAFIILICILSCSDDKKEPVIVNNLDNSKMLIDSFIVKKIFSRAEHIDSLAKSKKYKLLNYDYNFSKIKELNCIEYKFSWVFKPQNLNVYSIELYGLSIRDTSFGEEQYYYNSKSFFFTDPDGNKGLMDFGLRTHYSYYLHSFSRSRFSSNTYNTKVINDMFKEKKIIPFDNIMEWDSLYDAKH